MVPAMTTLLFLMVLWMLAGISVRIAAESGERITAAVSGLRAPVARQRGRAAA